MERSDAAHDAPGSRRGLSAHGSALVCLADARAELATVLILQELGLNVDVATDEESAIGWVRQARYGLLVIGGTRTPIGGVARRLRLAAPDARIVVLADDLLFDNPLHDDSEPPPGLVPLDIPLDVEVLWPPLDVNTLMRGLARAA